MAPSSSPIRPTARKVTSCTSTSTPCLTRHGRAVTSASWTAAAACRASRRSSRACSERRTPFYEKARFFGRAFCFQKSLRTVASAAEGDAQPVHLSADRVCEHGFGDGADVIGLNAHGAVELHDAVLQRVAFFDEAAQALGKLTEPGDM